MMEPSLGVKLNEMLFLYTSNIYMNIYKYTYLTNCNYPKHRKQTNHQTQNKRTTHKSCWHRGKHTRTHFIKINIIILHKIQDTQQAYMEPVVGKIIVVPLEIQKI